MSDTRVADKSGDWTDIHFFILDHHRRREEKEWWIEDGNYQKCLQYLNKSGLFEQYREVEKFISDDHGKSLKIADLAAGIGWSSALLSQLSNVAEVHAVDISVHRLSSLFENAV